MFFDRYNAKNHFENTKASTNKEWIIISGDKGIGKSSFIKEMIKNNDRVIYCEPTIDLIYWRNFYYQIMKYSMEIVSEYSKKNKDSQKMFEEYGKFIKDLKEEHYNEILENLIQDEISKHHTILSQIIGTILAQRIDYIVLDNLFLCDASSYEWLVCLSKKFITTNNHFIAICDTNIMWKSKNVKSVFINNLSSIDISTFDNHNAYFDLLSSKIYFNNGSKLKAITDTLYDDFNGDAKLILKLLDIVTPQIKYSDDDTAKEKIIFKTAGNLLVSNFDDLNLLEKNILAVLSISPVALTVELLEKILDHDSNFIRKSIDTLMDKDLIEYKIDIELKYTQYQCSTTFSKKTYINLVSETMAFYFLQKIYALYKKNELELSDAQLISIILQIKPENMIKQIISYIDKHQEEIDEEKKSELLSVVIDNSLEISTDICNKETVDSLYKFGHYTSAKKIFNHVNDFTNDYSLLMKYGDILHLLLDPATASTFKKASEIEKIGISDKLSAINRQIMAMTQQDKENLERARILYQRTIDKYSNEKCHGLIELYRNANNIFEYSKALEYTIIGYKLACTLNDKLEEIKCLHNICMLELLSGTYNSINIPRGLDVKPSFKRVYNMLSEYPYFRHEVAYPLLDMANNEMFLYDETNDYERIKKAKSLYSEAQLYAKSFYAKNISEMGLLIVNSYLYKQSKSVRNIRKRLFKNYQNIQDKIHDFRVHRKILFTLSTSALITNDIEEGRIYLRLSKKHVFEGEIIRYNNLCNAFDLLNERLPLSDLNIKDITSYHQTTKFVPWLISFGH